MIWTLSHKVIGGATVKVKSLLLSFLLAFSEDKLHSSKLHGLRVVDHGNRAGWMLIKLSRWMIMPMREMREALSLQQTHSVSMSELRL